MMIMLIIIVNNSFFSNNHCDSFDFSIVNSPMLIKVTIYDFIINKEARLHNFIIIYMLVFVRRSFSKLEIKNSIALN